jgi:hypothetical protein
VRNTKATNIAQRKGEKRTRRKGKKKDSSRSITIASKDAMPRKERQIRVAKNQGRTQEGGEGDGKG